MISDFLSLLAQFVIDVIQSVGYIGVFFLMALDSFNIPIPSEVTMPFSGFLSSRGVFSFWYIVLAGTLGSYIGSVCSYVLAGWLIKNKDKFIIRFFITDSLLNKASIWFKKYGQSSVFFGRIIPVVRTFISLPAGLGRMPFKKFSYFTIAGSVVWSVLLTYIGWVLGENWNTIREYFHMFDIVIALLIVVGVILWIYKHLRNRKL